MKSSMGDLFNHDKQSFNFFFKKKGLNFKQFQVKKNIQRYVSSSWSQFVVLSAF